MKKCKFLFSLTGLSESDPGTRSMNSQLSYLHAYQESSRIIASALKGFIVILLMDDFLNI